MSALVICDFCGKQMNTYSFFYQKKGGRLSFIPEGSAKSNLNCSSYDLCSACCEKVTKFIDDSSRKYEAKK